MIFQRHDRLSHHAVSRRSVACREYLVQWTRLRAETAVRRCKLAAVCSMQSTARLQRRRTTAAAPTIVPIKSHQSHGIMTLPPGGGIVHLRSGLLRGGGVGGLDVLDDGGVKTDRYQCCFLSLSPWLSLSLPSIGDDDQSVSVQILMMVGRAAHKSILQCLAGLHTYMQQCNKISLVPHSLTLPLHTAAWPHAIIAQSSARVHCDRDHRQAWAWPWACPAIHGGAQ